MFNGVFISKIAVVVKPKWLIYLVELQSRQLFLVFHSNQIALQRVAQVQKKFSVREAEHSASLIKMTMEQSGEMEV